METFSADQAVVTIHGVNIHPSIAKGRMVNAVRVAGDFIARLPRDGLSPETTDGRDGFLHPYDIAGRRGRDEDEDSAPRFRRREARRTGRPRAAGGRRHDAGVSRGEDRRGHRAAVSQHGRRAVREPRAVAYAEEALRRLGRTGKQTIVRGGTDGSRLTEMGLPTPNLSCGGHNPHSPLEWACLDEMVESVEWLVKLAEVWGCAEKTRDKRLAV